jgi:hypothetical protein
MLDGPVHHHDMALNKPFDGLVDDVENNAGDDQQEPF